MIKYKKWVTFEDIVNEFHWLFVSVILIIFLPLLILMPEIYKRKEGVYLRE